MLGGAAAPASPLQRCDAGTTATRHPTHLPAAPRLARLPPAAWQKLRVTCFPASCGYPCSCGSAAGQAYLEGDDVPACDRVFQGTAPSTIPGSDGVVGARLRFTDLRCGVAME